MAGYATTARIERATPRLRSGRNRDDAPTGVPSPSVEEVPQGMAPSVADVSGRGVAADLVDLLADIRDVWRQGREVLSDPQGWRVGL